MFCTCTETTARVRAEREASVAFDRLHDLFEQAPVFMCVLRGPDQVFELVNGSYLQLVGGRNSTGKPVREALLEVEDQGFFELLNRIYATGEPFIGRGAPIMLRQGPDQQTTERFVDFVYQPIHDGDGRVTGIFVEGSDVTEAYLATEALKGLTATLEQCVEERTLELQFAEEQLRQAQKMEAVGQLTGGIAHDFNNMLTVVIGSLDLLGRRLGTADPRARRYVDAAADGARRAANLTQRLLAFSRQQPLQPEPLDVNRLVAGMSDLLRHSLGTDVPLETVLAGGLWRAHADPNQLENVILNLAVNVRDAMAEGGRLTIETQNAYLDDRYAAAHLGVPAGQYVLIAVTDNGSGMPDSVIAKAFEPFFTTKEVGKGTGLGLSQVFGFAKQSGGDVAVDSAVGEGTTFTLYLPRIEASRNLAGATDFHEDDTAATDGGRRVLLVEDNVEVGRFAVQVLEDLGHQITWAANAAEALAILAEGSDRFDIMFSDVVMPGMNGIELGRAVRERYPALPVVLTSGYSHVLAQEGRHGFELVQKPYAAGDLSRVLNRMSRPGRHTH